MEQSLADLTLLAACEAYAAWLETHKRLEPDWTFVEVGAGVAACLTHAVVSNYLRRGDWQDADRGALRSLALGAVPIVAGELRQWWRREQERRRYLSLNQ